MKKNKSIFIAILIFGLIIGGVFFNNAIKADSYYNERAKVLKEELKSKKTTVDNSPIVLQGENISITENEIDLKTKAYKLNKNDKSELAALKHLLEQKVLLNKAIKLGYLVTEEEVDNEIEAVKKAVRDAENYSEYENFMNEYNGGEDAYWVDIRDTLKDKMIINKYLDSEKEIYDQTHQNQLSNSKENLLEGWNNYKSEIINSLIDDEKIIIKDNKFDISKSDLLSR
jgi:parvulin-like peptidyl-prolyl isomerase